MDKIIQLFEEFILKAIEQTEAAITYFDHGDKIESFTANRDRLFLVIDQISKQVNWDEITEEKKAELSQRIEYIKKLDEKLLVKLQEHRESLRSDIEKTHKQSESIKGYNLNDVK